MNFNLITGSFSKQEAEELITQMVHIKIKFQEDKIQAETNALEDIKMREKRIIELQKGLYEMRQLLKKQPERINLFAQINIAAN